MKILVTGASGYIGGRLVPLLLTAGHEVRCLTRDRRRLERDPWFDRVEVVEGDVLDPVDLAGALSGCDRAYYLIHSMEAGDHDFAERDRQAARNFAAAAQSAGLGRIIYLGGLGSSEETSKHLESRHEVGSILAAGSVPVTELRAAVIIGSGSVSFEMLRYLTEVLPVMITPRWVRTRCQPIAVADVLDILVSSIGDSGESKVREIGGPDQLTYEEMMQIYAEEAGLRRRVILPVPLLTPRLSSHWVGLVTPLPTGVAKPLVESLRVEVVVRDPGHEEALMPYREAVAQALEYSARLEVETRWSDAASKPARTLSGDPEWAGGTWLTDVRRVSTSAEPRDLFWAFTRIGGGTGYYTANWAWALRGLLDTIIGGVGLRRGRRHPEQITTGEALDFWRVVSIDPDSHLELYAEMKLPGQAWLRFDIDDGGSDRQLVQRAVFRPRGLWGRLYWLVLMPFHTFIFGRMAKKIVEIASSRPSTQDARPASS